MSATLPITKEVMIKVMIRMIRMVMIMMIKMAMRMMIIRFGVAATGPYVSNFTWCQDHDDNHKL